MARKTTTLLRFELLVALAAILSRVRVRRHTIDVDRAPHFGRSSLVNITPPIISEDGSFGIEIGAEPSVKITTSDSLGPELGIGRGGPCITSVRHLSRE